MQNEVKLLLELLPKYCAHVERYPHTLLIKFYGLHRVVPNNGSKVRNSLVCFAAQTAEVLPDTVVALCCGFCNICKRCCSDFQRYLRLDMCCAFSLTQGLALVCQALLRQSTTTIISAIAYRQHIYRPTRPAADMGDWKLMSLLQKATRNQVGCTRRTC